MSRKHQVLLLVVGILLVAVVLDKTGVLASSAESGSLRAAYTERAALVELQRTLVNSIEALQNASDRAEQAWSAASSRVLHARSTDLAEEDLHDRIQSEMRSENISLAAWRAIDQPAPQNAEAPSEIHRIELVFEFASPSPDAIYRLVDRIENMPDLWARAVSIDIQGPGLMQIDGASLDVSLRVVAVAALTPTSNGRLADAR